MTKNKHLETYFRENYKSLVQLARRRVGDYSLALAEEAVQEAFSRACKYYRAYDKRSSFDAWFKAILANCINQIKSEERNKGVSYEDIEDIEGSSQRDVTFTKEVESILNSISERDQDILNMYFFYGFKTREISEFLNMSHDVVRDVIRRFRARVKQ